MNNTTSKEETYLIRRKKDGMYFGWEDTDICLAPIDKPRWYANPMMKPSPDYWIAKFDSISNARREIISMDMKDVEIVKMSTTIEPVK